MERTKRYLDFIREKGRPLSEINPGSSEIGLQVEDALKAIELLRDSELAILGGDILSDDHGNLVYAYQYWGTEYIYLNWYCNKENTESETEYCGRSYNVAKDAIKAANSVAERIRKSCYIVIVI